MFVPLFRSVVVLARRRLFFFALILLGVVPCFFPMKASTVSNRAARVAAYIHRRQRAVPAVCCAALRFCRFQLKNGLRCSVRDTQNTEHSSPALATLRLSVVCHAAPGPARDCGAAGGRARAPALAGQHRVGKNADSPAGCPVEADCLSSSQPWSPGKPCPRRNSRVIT